MSDLWGVPFSPGQIAQTAGNAFTIDNSGQPWTGTDDWRLRLQPGSWRGCGFVLDAGETHAGRRVAIHEYPYRDTIWVEDLGKLPRRFNITAFLVGDDVYSQRDALVNACEQAGPGTLVHPTMGTVQCVMLDFIVTDRRERGRMVEVSMQFVLAGAVAFPGITAASTDAISNAASALGTASMSDLGHTLGGFAIAIPTAARQVTGFTSMVTSAVGDATRSLNAVRGLVGYFGRFDTGGRTTLLPSSATVGSCLSAATTLRSAVLQGCAQVNQLAGLL